MKRYALGIDLGTTHTALSYFNLEEGTPRGAQQPILPLTQLTGPGTIEDRPLLPSFLYLPADSEFPEGALALPWDKNRKEVLGELARSHGAKVPGRLVSSAKSWLSHPGVDRRQPILPWQAPEDVSRVSPVEVQARLLRHLREVWERSFGKGKGSASFAEQEVVLTVPASFDAASRELTLEAAAQADYPKITLLEEPQAALYAWIEAQGDGFRKQIKPGEVILVVDVGGGTTDFSLITVVDQQGSLELRRLAVGDHILLGGDNMDLALGYVLSQKLQGQGKTVDRFQLQALTYAARQAKEQLFGDDALSAAPVAIAGRGSSLMGGTLRTELTREELERLLVEGFFPKVGVAEAPKTARATGLAQMALPYAQDAAVTRHLGFFLARQAKSLSESGELPAGLHGKGFVHPTAVLFNGGVFKARALRQRVMDVLNAWLASESAPAAKALEGADLDLSVARGAAYYGWVREGHGIRIRGGTARSYYVGVEVPTPAVPGMAPPVRALCVAPFGMEEGTSAEVPPQEFGLVVGEPTRFRFFSSSVRREDRVGQMLDDVEGNSELEEMAPIETTLAAGAKVTEPLIPVHLQAAVTEMGSLELRCLQRNGEGRWKLELNVRAQD